MIQQQSFLRLMQVVRVVPLGAMGIVRALQIGQKSLGFVGLLGTVVQLLAAASLVMTLGGCASRSDSEALTPSARSTNAPTKLLLIATNRRLDADDAQFDVRHAPQLSYELMSLYARTPGEGLDADSAERIAIAQRDRIDASAFRSKLRALVGQSGEVVVFVHGYNTKYHEAVFRLGQIALDSQFYGAAVLFSWPSEGVTPGYLHDKESATFSRDRLEEVVRLVAATPGVRKIHLIAHSMGCWLTAEMLRQAKIRGDMEFGGKLGNVLLASPDIDVEVFRSQLDVIGKRNPPIVVTTSSEDKALAVSSLLAGDNPRVGNLLLENPELKAEIERKGLIVVDTSNVQSPDPLNHTLFSSPTAASAIARYLKQTGNPYVHPGVWLLGVSGALSGIR